MNRPMADRLHTVYRYADHKGRVLYVGVTSRGLRRAGEHEIKSQFLPFMATQEFVSHYPTRVAALEAEASLIRRLKPPFNRVHNPDWPKGRDAYLIEADPEFARRMADPAAALAEDIGHELPLKVLTWDEDGYIYMRGSVDHRLALRRLIVPLGTSLVTEAGDAIGRFEHLNDVLCHAWVTSGSIAVTAALVSVKPVPQDGKTWFQVSSVEASFCRPPRWFAGEDVVPPQGVEW